MPCLGLLVTCQATDNRTASNELLNNTGLVVVLRTATQFAITVDYADRENSNFNMQSNVDASRYLQSHNSINSNSSQKNDMIRGVHANKYLLFREIQKNAKDSIFRNDSENLSSDKEKIYLDYKRINRTYNK